MFKILFKMDGKCRPYNIYIVLFYCFLKHENIAAAAALVASMSNQ